MRLALKGRSSVGGRRIPTRIVHRRKTDNRTKSGVLGIRQLEKGGQHETFPPERTLKAAISLIHNFLVSILVGRTDWLETAGQSADTSYQ